MATFQSRRRALIICVTVADRYCTPMHLAVMVGNLSLVKMLLAHGANVNEYTLCPVVQEQCELVSVLDRMVNIEVPGSLTPLHIAAKNLDMQMVELLCEAKADINAVNLPLCGELRIKRIVCGNGYVNLVHDNNMSPLKYAKRAKGRENLNIIEYLVSNGAKFEDNETITPADNAKDFLSLHIETLVLGNGMFRVEHTGAGNACIDTLAVGNGMVYAEHRGIGQICAKNAFVDNGLIESKHIGSGEIRVENAFIGNGMLKLNHGGAGAIHVEKLTMENGAVEIEHPEPRGICVGTMFVENGKVNFRDGSDHLHNKGEIVSPSAIGSGSVEQ